MWDDPIVAETREVREQIAARFDYDIWALGEYYKAKRAKDAITLIAKSTEKAKRKRARTNPTKAPNNRLQPTGVPSDLIGKVQDASG